jgi:hypothetical protein
MMCGLSRTHPRLRDELALPPSNDDRNHAKSAAWYPHHAIPIVAAMIDYRCIAHGHAPMNAKATSRRKAEVRGLLWHCRGYRLSKRTAINASLHEQRGHTLPCVEHPGFHRIQRNVDNFRHRRDWLFVVVNEVKNFPVALGKLRQTTAQNLVPVLFLCSDFWTLRRILDGRYKRSESAQLNAQCRPR